MRYLSLIILFFISTVAKAQLLEGLILDNETKEPIQGVTVINRHTNTIVVSDAKGHYAIQTSTGDTVTFSHTAYHTVTETILFSLGKRYKTILMVQSFHKLNETTVTGLSKYQEDSLDNREEYKGSLRQNPGKVNTYFGFGVATEGLISNLVGNITGYNKRYKHFKKALRTDEQNKFIDTRYTPILVAEVTPLHGDSAVDFMHAYPMSYDFARAASDLEIKMWIKYNYKDYLKQNSGKN